MSKYINADKLIAEVKALKRRKGFLSFENTEITEAYMARGVQFTCDDVVNLIVSLQQEQPDLPSGEDVMIMCNQILIDWVKEGKDQEEKEQRKQAHIRFFELYDDYLMKDQPEVDLEKTVEFECIGKKVKMTIQELINYYIDSECCDVTDECRF